MFFYKRYLPFFFPNYPPKAIAKAVASANVAAGAPESNITPLTLMSPVTFNPPARFNPPDNKTLPLVVVILPVAASIVKGPTVSPLWTTKFELAIVPYLPNVLL
jgi:hypothetical protein